MYAALTILGMVGTLALMAWYLYRAGALAQRRKDELAALKERDKIEEAARTVWADLDSECADRRKRAVEFMRRYLQEREVPPPSKPMP